jgi:hypothetical protein
MQDLLNHLIGCLVGMLVRAAASGFQALVAELAISVSPYIKRRSRDSEVPACLVDVSDSLCVFEDSLFSMNFSLIAVHLDLLGHHLDR